MSQTENLHRLKLFLRKEFGVRSTEVRPAADLVKDIGIDGADGVELVDRFSDEFGVAFPETFRYSDFFGDDSFGLGFRRKPSPAPKSITISDLLKAMETGVWDKV